MLDSFGHLAVIIDPVVAIGIGILAAAKNDVGIGVEAEGTQQGALESVAGISEAVNLVTHTLLFDRFVN